SLFIGGVQVVPPRFERQPGVATAQFGTIAAGESATVLINGFASFERSPTSYPNTATVYSSSSESNVDNDFIQTIITLASARPIEEGGGPPGAFITSLAIDFQNRGTVYAGTQAGVYKSTNNGTNWEPANNGLPRAEIDALAIDQTHPATLYASAN